MTYLFSTALLFDIPLKACVSILLSPRYYFLSLLGVASGYGLWEMKRWGWYIFLTTTILVGYNNAVLVSDFGTTHHKILAFLLSTFVLLGLILRVAREVRVPYFLPKIRWWESNPRYKLSVPTIIRREDGSTVEGEVMDLSSGGCFVKVRNELSTDERILVSFTIFGQEIETTGTIVWKTQGAVTHPKGIGIKFGLMSRLQKRILKAVNGRLKEISQLYHSSRLLMNREDFSKRMIELQGEKLNLPARLVNDRNS